MSNTGEKARSAKIASYELAKATAIEKDGALRRIADRLFDMQDDIVAANAKDLEAAEGQISKALYQRLRFDNKKLKGAVAGIESLISLPDPIGETRSAMELSEGLELFNVTSSIGVIGCVFESRPDALVQISTLCLKSGNSVILKGGSEAANTNKILYESINSASRGEGIPAGWIQLVESRQEVAELLTLDEHIDLMIPRGSNDFVRHIQENTRIPVLGHAAGICHVYIDEAADIEMAKAIALDSKTQYPAVCNAMETLLVHEDIAEGLLPDLWDLLAEAGVVGKGCEEARRIIPALEPAKKEDWHTEYNDLVLNVKVIESVRDATVWINEYGSHHTDAIVTEDPGNARYFLESVDSSSVMWNASTRFSDGFRYGLGAEVGISTGKVHARGPVGLEGMTTYKWILKGGGQTVGAHPDDMFTHKPLKKKWA